MLSLSSHVPPLRRLVLLGSLVAGQVAPSSALAAEAPALPVVHARTTTVDGQKVFYREAGDPKAPAIVLLHGFPSSSHMYRELILRLAGQFHVVAPDYIGFGYSAAPSPDTFSYTFDHLASTVQGLLDQIGVRDTVYYMQDYGGPVGLRLASAHPKRVRGLVFQNANAYLDGVGKPLADVFLPLWKEQNPATLAAARGFLKPETTRFQYTYGAQDAASLNPDAWTHDQALLDRPGNEAIQLALFVDYKNNVGLFGAWQAYFREAQPRTLVIWGKNDPFFVVAGAEAFKRDLPEADITFVEGGHFALEEHAPAIAERIIRAFATRTSVPVH